MAKEYYLRFGTGNPADTAGLAPTLTHFRSWTGGVITAPGITQPVATMGIYRFEYSPSFSIFFVADGATTGLASASRYVTGSLDPLDLMDERVVELQAAGVTMIGLGLSNIALGNTNVALGTTNFAIGTTLIGMGNTMVGLGVTNVALGTTMVAIGTTLLGIGSTNMGIGVTLGANMTELLARVGSTLSSIGSTLVDPGDLHGYVKRLQELLEGNGNFDKTTGAWQMLSRGATLLREKTMVNAANTVTKS